MSIQLVSDLKQTKQVLLLLYIIKNSIINII